VNQDADLTTLLMRDPAHPAVRRLLLRRRERVLMELRDLDELLNLPPTVPTKRERLCEARSHDTR
jgi:hypothetical protein